MIQIIPAIDLINGKCVRLMQGDYNRSTTYNSTPLELSKLFESNGIKRLHIIDLDGAKEGVPCNLHILRAITLNTSLEVEWGGGIRTMEDVKTVFDCGASHIICSSIAIERPDLFSSWLHRFGGNKIILGADISQGKVAMHGWADLSDLSITELITRFIPDGLKQVLCTDISKDGMLEGPSYGLYSYLQKKYPDIDIIVSGGISSINDIKKLNNSNLRYVIVGKAIYENRITLKEIKLWSQKE